VVALPKVFAQRILDVSAVLLGINPKQLEDVVAAGPVDNDNVVWDRPPACWARWGHRPAASGWRRASRSFGYGRISTALDQNGSTIDHKCLASAESFLHQE